MKLEKQQTNMNTPTPNPPPHVFVLPFPFQGHINPALQFSKLLISKGLRVTLILAVQTTELTQGQLGSLAVHFLSTTTHDHDHDPILEQDGFGFLERYKRTVTKNLPRLASDTERETGSPVACLVYDSVAPWALEVAKELNIPGAAFFTQPLAVDAIFYSYHEGKIRAPIVDKDEKFRVEGMAEMPLEVRDLPSYLRDDDEIGPECLALLAAQFSNVAEADWIFCNTFTALEEKIVDWMCSKFRFKPVGPTIPSIYLGKKKPAQEEDTCHEYGLGLFKPQHSQTYLKHWLDSQQPKSVVYVSFGSVATLSDKETEEVAAALKKIGRPFLWVVRKSEQGKIPAGFAEDTSGEGGQLVVTWCCQLEVLAHESVGCFVTHSGWNSTIEALSMGVPMVAVPQFADQPTNAKFVEDVWRVGVRVAVKKGDGEGKGMAMREEIEWGVMEVMEGERAKGIRKNADKWKTLARAAVADGGSSDRNVQEFVDELVNLQLLKGLKL